MPSADRSSPRTTPPRTRSGKMRPAIPLAAHRFRRYPLPTPRRSRKAPKPDTRSCCGIRTALCRQGLFTLLKTSARRCVSRMDTHRSWSFSRVDLVADSPMMIPTISRTATACRAAVKRKGELLLVRTVTAISRTKHSHIGEESMAPSAKGARSRGSRPQWGPWTRQFHFS